MTRRFRCLCWMALVGVLWLVFGCATSTLREAQDHFNKGADIELRAMDRSLLSDMPDANPGDTFSALNEYRLAYAVATRLTAEKPSALKQDKLLGATYILKAMALWRIAALEGTKLTDGELPKATQPTGKVAIPRQDLLDVLN